MISYNHSREDSYLPVYYLHEHSAPWLQNWLGTNRTTYYTINIFLVALHALFIFWISVSRFYNSANTVKRRSLKNIVFVVWWSICSRKTFIVWWASISWFLKMRGPVNSWKLIFLPVELDFFLLDFAVPCRCRANRLFYDFSSGRSPTAEQLNKA